jgi:nitrate/nitrite transport system permease protein
MVSAVFHSPLEALLSPPSPPRRPLSCKTLASPRKCSASSECCAVATGRQRAPVPFDWRALWLRIVPPVLGSALLVLVWELVRQQHQRHPHAG